jgi:SWI/SNF related-matrix-associated actin-dependent regulator of chromatin subfamily C
MLSEFFDGKSISKTAKIYKDYRDFIINKYRENTERALTFTEVRRMLIGDVNALRRVFDFLDHWGLINHQVVQEGSEPIFREGLPAGQTLVEPIPTGVRMAAHGAAPLATSRSGQLDTFTSVSSTISGLQPETLSSYKNAFASTKDRDAATAVELEKLAPRYSCNSCGEDCTSVLFRCQRENQVGSYFFSTYLERCGFCNSFCLS